MDLFESGFSIEPSRNCVHVASDSFSVHPRLNPAVGYGGKAHDVISFLNSSVVRFATMHLKPGYV